MAVRTLFQARAGLETTRNTGVAPTRRVYFTEAAHTQDVGTISPSELRNSYFGNFRHYQGIERNSIEISADGTYDDLIWYLNLHVKAVAAGTGGAADKTWAFVPTASSDDLKSATVEFGWTDSATLWSLPGCLGETLNLAFRKGETLGVTSTLLSAKGAAQIGAFTGTGTDRDTVSVVGTGMQVWIDTTTIGTTLDANVNEVDFNLTNGFAHRDALDGTNVAQELKRPNPRSWTLTTSRYFGSDTELDAYVAKTLRKVRIRAPGPALGGTAYNLTLDCYGVWEAHAWSEVDGLIYAGLTLRPQYDTGAATDFSITVVNATAAIT
jgi:hypothetical protein